MRRGDLGELLEDGVWTCRKCFARQDFEADPAVWRIDGYLFPFRSILAARDAAKNSEGARAIQCRRGTNMCNFTSKFPRHCHRHRPWPPPPPPTSTQPRRWNIRDSPIHPLPSVLPTRGLITMKRPLPPLKCLLHHQRHQHNQHHQHHQNHQHHQHQHHLYYCHINPTSPRPWLAAHLNAFVLPPSPPHASTLYWLQPHGSTLSPRPLHLHQVAHSSTSPRKSVSKSIASHSTV